jgi:hypothetical protein
LAAVVVAIDFLMAFVALFISTGALSRILFC